ncbi:MAG: hypothetical protein HETSPECPRED_000754 [Heterodermia speciosa]|uniref:Gfd2/YDR514C-like C-terminal domain-containing protein n=1 Tax=Heterodermia speciosa TaxID=116794 RepID=A0A8H3G7Q0_9LECA|nr:MAG: hypothetical protein HETSPECPRED_000754 [Heterodermia speciosa]
MKLGHIVMKKGLPFLQHCLGLDLETANFANADNIVFVAIDFENQRALTQAFETPIRPRFQLGIAILDTKNLISSSSSYSSNLITVRNYVSGSKKYRSKIQKKFISGETVQIQRREDLVTHLNNSIPRTRKIVLVGHSFMMDLLTLRHLNFDLDTSIVAVLDTQLIAHNIMKCSTISLKALLTKLEIPFENLHVGGQDAYFALRALLKMATQNCVPSENNEAAIGMILNARFVPFSEESNQAQVFAQEQSPRFVTATAKAHPRLKTSSAEAAAGRTKVAAEAETDGEVDPQEGGLAINEGNIVKEKKWDEALPGARIPYPPMTIADSRSLEPHHSLLSLGLLLVLDFLRRLLGIFTIVEKD